MAIVYRRIRSDDWPVIGEMYIRQGWTETFPHTSISSGVVIEDNNKIVGFGIIQPLIRVEPIYIDPAYRGKIFVMRLVHEIASLLPKGVQCFFGLSPIADIIAKRIGANMITSTGTVYIKEVQ